MFHNNKIKELVNYKKYIVFMKSIIDNEYSRLIILNYKSFFIQEPYVDMEKFIEILQLNVTRKHFMSLLTHENKSQKK